MTTHASRPPRGVGSGEERTASAGTAGGGGGEATPKDDRPARLAWIAGVVLIGLSALGVAGLWLSKRRARTAEARARSAQVDKGPVVLVAKVAEAPPEREVQLTADVRGYFQTTLYAKVSGYVREIRVDKGDRVQKGQVLGRIESPETDQALDSARSTATLNAQLEARARILAPNVVAQQDLETARANLDVSRAGVQSARAMKEYEVIRAPFDGVVTARYVDPGALMPAATGGTQSALPFVDVGVVDKLRIDAYVAQDVAGLVRVGDPVTISQDERPGLAVAAQVSRLAGALDPRTRTMLVEVDLDNRAYGLLPGTFARVTLRVSGVATPTVPVEALVVRGGKNLVARVVADHVHLVAATLGKTDGKALEITSGVSPGDVVALNLPTDLEDGAAVVPQEKPQAGRGADGGP